MSEVHTGRSFVTIQVHRAVDLDEVLALIDADLAKCEREVLNEAGNYGPDETAAITNRYAGARDALKRLRKKLSTGQETNACPSYCCTDSPKS